MPNADVEFRHNESNNGIKNAYYYVEALPNETVERTYNGVGYRLYRHVRARYNFFTEAEDYIDLLALPDLRNAAWSRVGNLSLHSLYGIDDDKVWSSIANSIEYLLKTRLT